jgi:hypothetical protein
MPKYRLFDVDGGDLGEMRLGDVPIKVDEEIFLGPGRLRVLDVVPVEEEGSPFTGFLKVEPAEYARPRDD